MRYEVGDFAVVVSSNDVLKIGQSCFCHGKFNMDIVACFINIHADLNSTNQADFELNTMLGILG